MTWDGVDRREPKGDMNDHDLLVRIDERVEQTRNWQEEHMAKCHSVHDKHDTRLRHLEEWKWKEAGAIGLLVFGWTWLKEKLFP